MHIVAFTAVDSGKSLCFSLEIWYKKQSKDVDVDWRGTLQDPGQTSDA